LCATEGICPDTTGESISHQPHGPQDEANSQTLTL